MFSPKEIDKGSRKLVSVFSTKLFGEVADLGAGWGYLSKEALRLNKKITRITLFESNYSAYLASKKNIDDKRATFRWASLENIRNLRLRFDHVICNPPFHSGRRKDVELLKSFIFYSSRLIDLRGSVWMVFVSGVYLENELKDHFDNIKILYKDKHYFVCQLLKPIIKEV
jgi:16S rRNA (guanine1207-N2)-methyltransferase